MKRVFAILAVAGVMAACNNGSEDSAVTTDSTKTETPVMDATTTADSASKMMNNAADSASKMIEKAGDSATKMMEKAKEPVKH